MPILDHLWIIPLLPLLGSAINGLAWSPDGFHLAVGNDNGDMLLIDLRR